ncbi:hypothetical protein pipiens_007506 [Culex pipiens pipiens]|uniref:Uncharacterized protein n=1 Tax=Culex pipiens pipiens TaxID=38569 RepID=A0ABD1DLS1_CULPP
MFTDRKYSFEKDQPAGRDPSRNGDGSYEAYQAQEKAKKKLDPQKQIIELTSQKLKDLQTSFHSLRLEQTQIGDRLAKFERRGGELKKQQDDFNRDVNGTFEKVRRELVHDQEALAKASRETKNRLDALDVDKALIMERLKNLREDLDKERGGKGGQAGGVAIHERESAVQRMEVELKRLQAESNQQGKLLIGTACGAVVIVAYLLAARSTEVVALESKEPSEGEEESKELAMREKQMQVLVMLMHEAEGARRSLSRLWLVNGVLAAGLVAVGYLALRK